MSPIITNVDIDAFADRVVNLPPADAQERREKAQFLRDRLEKYIEANPGFSLVKMRHAGSVAKGTALRNVNDLDVAVYVRADDSPTEGATLVDWMTDRLREAYGNVIDPEQVQTGPHCPTITFKSGLVIDVVPILYEGDSDDRGYLISRITGERLLTSVKLHLAFIRARKKENPQHFAQVVRFLKWWAREIKKIDPAFKFKSFMAELLVAHLADTGLDLSDHVGALEETFGYIVKSGLEARISFDDFYRASELPIATGAPIEVIDPVNPQNNVASRYTISDRDQIVERADETLGAIIEAGFATTKAQAVACWQVVLGSRFKG